MTVTAQVLKENIHSSTFQILYDPTLLDESGLKIDFLKEVTL